MCLLFFSKNQHPSYPLIVVSNRDEFYNRNTKPAEYWPSQPHVLGGRDLQSSGTWLGMTTDGRIAWLTNYRDPNNNSDLAPSRGLLVSKYLTGTQQAREYIKMIEKNGSQYNPFNLVVGTVDELYYYSNYKTGIEKIRPGLYGLSNGLLDTPWPKVKLGKQKLTNILKKEKMNANELFEFLYDETKPADCLLPNTGIDHALEKALSSIFVRTPKYGTRCSTIIIVDNNKHLYYSERVFDPKSFNFVTKTFEQDICSRHTMK